MRRRAVGVRMWRTFRREGARTAPVGILRQWRGAYPRRVRQTEFWERMESRLGASYARSYAADQVLAGLAGRTVVQALSDGDDVKLVWRAVCDATQAPASER